MNGILQNGQLLCNLHFLLVEGLVGGISMIKGEKAKKEIETFLKSDEQVVSELAKELLEKWDKK